MTAADARQHLLAGRLVEMPHRRRHCGWFRRHWRNQFNRKPDIQKLSSLQ
jgi:hypothetical protein